MSIPALNHITHAFFPSPYVTAMQHQASLALSVAVTLNIADHLLPAGKEGLSAEELSTKALRYLVKKQIFSEAQENVFASNRDSLMLVKSSPQGTSYLGSECHGRRNNPNRVGSDTIDMLFCFPSTGLGFL
jgi:hypothetical protein